MKRLIQWQTVFLMLLSGPCLLAHSVHQSTAEAEFNPSSQKLEVSLTVFINDLELALIRHAEKLLSFEKTPPVEFDAEVLSYLTQTFVLTDARGHAAKIEWVGREEDTESVKSGDPSVTLFFTLALPDGPEGASLRHSVLCELFEDQVNLLHFRHNSQKREWSFSREHTTRKIRLSD